MPSSFSKNCCPLESLLHPSDQKDDEKLEFEPSFRCGIDSRSILRNKEKLKLFWQRKMELQVKQATRQDLVKPDLDANNNNNNNNSMNRQQQPNRVKWDQQPTQTVHLTRDHTSQVPTSEHNTQPMSIDPTLCHSGGLGETLEASEEQYANEEFASSSSSSSSASSSPSPPSLHSSTQPEESSGLGVTEGSSGRNADCGRQDSLSSALEAENIGVAFESLQFDTEIKSSRTERVDEKPPRSRNESNLRPLVLKEEEDNNEHDEKSTRFNAREVKSVCNLIDAAILDASKQVEELERAESDSNSVQRAAFMKPDETKGQADDESKESELDTLGQLEQADLSEIFEANVRREIERFESNSNMLRRHLSCSNQATNKVGGLIAREIHLFNEREKELKRRLKVSQPDKSPRQPPSSELESVVRFGKILQIPRNISKASNGTIKQLGIALTSTSCKQNEQPSTISMHKFIVSGGKRFLMSSSAISAGSLGSQSKSLGDLKTNNHNTQQSSRPVDFKANDSLRFKETPNVEPGMARKVIETFARLQSSTESIKSNNSSSRTPFFSSTIGQSQPLNCVTSHNSNCQSSSAELMILDELREMRVREAELRNQREGFKSNGTQSDAKDVTEPIERKFFPVRQTIDSFARKLKQSNEIVSGVTILNGQK